MSGQQIILADLTALEPISMQYDSQNLKIKDGNEYN